MPTGQHQGSERPSRGPLQGFDLNEEVARPGVREGHTNLEAVATSAAAREGVVWTLEASDDLNANLVRFGAGRGVGEHVNDEVDVVFVGVSGSGLASVDGVEHALNAGKLVFVPKGARRSTRSTSEDFAYLTIHRRRGPLRIGR